jgi:hypothetical protein
MAVALHPIDNCRGFYSFALCHSFLGSDEPLKRFHKSFWDCVARSRTLFMLLAPIRTILVARSCGVISLKGCVRVVRMGVFISTDGPI